MNAQTRNTRNEESQARRAELLRMVEARIAARNAAESHVIRSTVYQTQDPGPDFTPRPWR